MSIGGSHEAARPQVRRGLRIAMVFGALAALLLPMAYVFVTFWSTTRESEVQLAAERSGVRYLKPLVGLIGALAQAEAVAVDGAAVDEVRLRAAIAKVDAADRREGAALRTRERWTELRKELAETLKKKPTGHPAYHAYSGLNTSALALVTKVGEVSHLAGDARFGAGAGLLRLPGVAADAAHATALLRPADPSRAPSHGHDAKKGKSSGGNDHAGESPYAGAGRVAAVLDRISVSREAIREGLRRSGGGTVDSPDGLDALDEFATAVSALLELVKPAASGETVPVEKADAAGERVRTSVAKLTDQMLSTADAQLAAEGEAVADQRIAVTVAVVVGLLLALLLLWLSLPGHPQPAEPAESPGDAPGDAQHDAEPAPELIDARELLSSEELLHVGRAVRSTRGEPDDAH